MAHGRGGGLTAGNSLEKRRKAKEPESPELWGTKALPLLRQRARYDFARRINILADIADGKMTQQVTSTTMTGDKESKTVTVYNSSVKDRMQALRMLAEYGHVPTAKDSEGGGGHGDPAALTRALLGALADPVVRRALAADPDVGPAIRLLTAQEVPGTAIEVPGEDELNSVMAQEIVIAGDETAPETAQES
jgi:hypothetical protein